MPFSGLMFALTIEGQGTGPTGSEQMGQADAFETDFWKHANLRKAWDDIVPGEPRKTIPYTLTREAIALYCRAVGDEHPIYFDEAYARTTRYGGLPAAAVLHIPRMVAYATSGDCGCTSVPVHA